MSNSGEYMILKTRLGRDLLLLIGSNYSLCSVYNGVAGVSEEGLLEDGCSVRVDDSSCHDAFLMVLSTNIAHVFLGILQLTVVQMIVCRI